MNTWKRMAIGVCALSLAWGTARAQQTDVPHQRHTEAAPATPIEIDGSEAMFTTMCALYAAGFESDVSAENWTPMRAQIRDRMLHTQGPAVDTLRNFYKQHELAEPGAMLSRYIWFGLVSGPAPGFQPVLRRDELPPEVIALEGFREILANFYKEQHIGPLWKQVQPVYEHDIEQMHDAISQVVFITDGYLRHMNKTDDDRTFKIIVEPLVGRLTNVRNYGDHYAIVVGNVNDLPADVVRHAYLHFLLDPLPLQYSHVVAVKRPLYDQAAKAPRLDPALQDDFSSYFAENMVLAVELKLKRMSPSEREAEMDLDDADGLVLVRPLYVALAKFEESEPNMTYFFPDLVRSIDLNAEEKRVAALKFAPAGNKPAVDAASAEAVAHKHPQPTTVPNDPDAIAQLTEGERRIAEKNPQAAQASFQKVLEKYPDQPRAWYGLGLVAMMEHDADKAKQVFGRLTQGEHAATQDPMVLTWSHVYLARIYDIEKQPDKAKAEFEAALGVNGGPEQAKQAAEKGLAQVNGAKSN